LSGSRSYVVADIPGIIEGAHLGKGLGLKFLQHVERTRVLAFLVPVDSPDPQGVYDGLRTEVRSYSEQLYHKPHVVVLSKRDLIPADATLPGLYAPDARALLALSSAARTGLDEFSATLWDLVVEARHEDLKETAFRDEPDD
jgi:GTP-binding protein